jgi:Transglycosylase SLT domain
MKRRLLFSVMPLLCLLATPIAGLAQSPAPSGGGYISRKSICAIVDDVAHAHNLPGGFLTRVIWQESHFQPDAIGPLTFSGQHALGIAQFMPGTAVERKLYEPFDPAQALPKSGEFLADLRTEFGNLGLAAAAYNSGPQRLHAFLDGLKGLPTETRNYVLKITGHPVEEWASPSGKALEQLASRNSLSKDSPKDCESTVALLESSPNRVSVIDEQSKVPSWCRYLHHPATTACGSVHEFAVPLKFSLQEKQAGPGGRAGVHLPH